MDTHTETKPAPDSAAWDQELADLLSMLSAAQGDLLELLGEKRDFLLKADTAGLAALQPREEALMARLTACQDQRSRLLERAAVEGLPSDSIHALASALEGNEQRPLLARIKEARSRWRLLEHHSLTNWVLVQRTLIHLSQMLEIIATGGQPRPTYGKHEGHAPSGALVDQAA